MTIHSSNFAWRIPWTEERGGLQSMGSQRVGQTLHAGGSGAGQQGSLMVSVECSKDLLHGTCRTDWRLEKLESGRKPEAKSGKPGYGEGLGHTRGSGKGGDF